VIRQGHAYRVHGYGKCIALETQEAGRVRCLTAEEGDLYPAVVWLDAQHLQPAPMRYFHGETPA